MDLLLIGLSRFAQRRVLPAAATIPAIETVNVVSSQVNAGAPGRVPKLGSVYADVDTALGSVGRGLVYVSVVNGFHDSVVRRALEHGHHVVVDKPGFPDLGTAERMVALAQDSSLVLAEATCYEFHPLFAAVRSVLAGIDAPATTAMAVFTPPVPPSDWRWDRAAGGGAISDTGPYAVSLGRVLWGAALGNVHSLVNGRTADGLETSYSMIASYPEDRVVLGQFGFTTAYQNSLQLMGPGFTLGVERVFSAPPDLAVEIRVRTAERTDVHIVEPADSMQAFLSAVLAAADLGAPDFARALLADARALDQLRRSAASVP